MTYKWLIRGIPIRVILLLPVLYGCGYDRPLEVHRPSDPWVMRSVLDQRPRMVSLALHEQAYAAYDLESCTFYKLWKGGVHWDGAAFNNVKTVQPQSWGTAYWQPDPSNNPWRVIQNGQLLNVGPRFKGYHLANGRIRFQYQFLWGDSKAISVFEVPEVEVNAHRKIAFLRTFEVIGAPAGLEISYAGRLLQSNAITVVDTTFGLLPDMPLPTRQSTDNKAMQWLDRSGCNTCHQFEQKTTGPSYHQIAQAYTNDKETIARLTEKVQQGGRGVWGEISMPAHANLAQADIREMVKFILSLQPIEKPTLKPTLANNVNANKPTPKKPGFGAALVGLHPSLKLQTIRPAWFKPRVGGMDFLADGTLLLSTWDSIGAVYALKGLQTGDTNHVKIQRIASGLAEPLGLKVVDGEIFVMQKNELTQLVDLDGDGMIDEYRALCNSFGVTADFHEYSYGLEFKDGYFYATLGLAMRLMDHEWNHPDRGAVLKISRNGDFEKMVTGLRQPNGIGKGPDGELFITENQGNWVPACKIIHVKKGDFHGCLMNSGSRFDGLASAPPALWLPHDEIGNSPGQPIFIDKGIYKGQMLHGEVTHGGIKRVFLEKVQGDWQGCVFRFTQGLEAGINRLAWAPDGALYAGGVGMNGNWAWNGAQYGLQKLVFTDAVAFEMLRVKVVSQGVEIEFTEPLAKGHGEIPSDYLLQQWRYEPTANYGGPKLDLTTLKAQSVVLSKDRKSVRLSIPGLKEKFVLYILLDDKLKSVTGQLLWSGEAWYTVNRLQKDKS